MRILTVLTYYRPHTSGLTIYAERLAKALVRRGHKVTILTSQFNPKLAKIDVDEGVKIVRVPVFMRISKGVVMPSFGFVASRLVHSHDAVHLHLPQFDAAGLSFRGRIFNKPTVCTYHCDLLMPPGIMNNAANIAVHFMNHLTAKFTHSIVTYTHDYAEHSPFLNHYLRKVKVIPPPVDLPSISDEQRNVFRLLHNSDSQRPVIGMAARFGTEKGVEILLQSMPAILNAYPKLLIQFAGPWKDIVGEERYSYRLMPLIQQYQRDGHWHFLDVLTSEQMAAFYANIDLLVLPSLNSTEAFGLVQIEAMINNVPCIASDLPGVRQPIKRHSMGEIIPIGDSVALGQAVIKILKHPRNYHANITEIRSIYQPETIAQEYEELFLEIKDRIK